jgi:hypothetical protein
MSVIGKLPITHYPLPITHYPLPITHYPLPITHYPLPITHYPLPITHHLRSPPRKSDELCSRFDELRPVGKAETQRLQPHIPQ